MTMAIEMAMWAVLAAPFLAALVNAGGWMAARRGIERYDVSAAFECTLREQTDRQRKRKATKRELLRETSEATIASARRVLVAQRKDWAELQRKRAVEVLTMADIRRNVKRASRQVAQMEAA